MAVGFQTSAKTAGSASSTQTLPINVGAAAGRCLLIGLHIRSVTASATAPTYAGSNLTLAGRTTGTSVMTEIWYLPNPTSGSNVAVINNGAGRTLAAVGAAFNGIQLSSPINVYAGTLSNSTNPSGSITTTGRACAVASFLTDESNNPVTAVTGGTQMQNTDEGVWVDASAYNLQTQAETETISYTLGTADSWAIGMVGLQDGQATVAGAAGASSAPSLYSLLVRMKLGSLVMAATSSVSSAFKRAAQLLSGLVASVTSKLSGLIFVRYISSGGAVSPIAQSSTKDYPSSLPDFDHYWNLAGDYTDQPGSGKSQLDLSDTGSGLTWQTDWAGRSSQALQFNGSRALYHANHADLNDLGSTFTLVFGFKMVTNTSLQVLFDNRSPSPTNGLGISLWDIGDGSSVLEIDSYSGGVNSLVQYISVAPGTYIIGLSVSGGNYYLYKNGSQVKTGSLTAPGASTVNDCTFGVTSDYGSACLPNNSQLFYLATLKGTALTSTQMQTLYDTWVSVGGGSYKRHPDNPQTAASGGMNAISSTICAGFTTLAKALQGVVAAAASITTNLTTTGARLVAGAVAAITSVSSSLRARFSFSGLSAVTTTASAKLKLLFKLSGLASTISSVTGPTLRLRLALGGTASSLTSVVARLRLFLRLAGSSLAMTSTSLAKLLLRLVLSGASATASAVSFARLRLLYSLSSTVVALTSATFSGFSALARALSGVVSSATTATAHLMLRLSVSGAAVARTLTSASIKMRLAVAGSITAATSVVLAGFASLAKLFTGTVSALTSVTSALRLRLPLSGAISATTSVVTAVYRQFRLAASAVATTATSARLTLRMRLAGTISTLSAVSAAALRLRLAVSGAINALTSVIANFTSTSVISKLVAGTVAAITSATAALRLRMLLAGAATAATQMLANLWTSSSAAIVTTTRRFIGGMYTLYIKAKDRWDIEP